MASAGLRYVNVWGKSLGLKPLKSLSELGTKFEGLSNIPRRKQRMTDTKRLNWLMNNQWFFEHVPSVTRVRIDREIETGCYREKEDKARAHITAMDGDQ